MKTLLERKAEFLLPLFRSLSDVKEKSSEFDLVFALRKHPDRDVSLTAWRKLASQASGVPALQGELEQALKGNDAELRQVLCANLRGQTNTEESEKRRYWERFGMNLPKPGSAPASVETNDALSALYGRLSGAAGSSPRSGRAWCRHAEHGCGSAQSKVMACPAYSKLQGS